MGPHAHETAPADLLGFFHHSEIFQKLAFNGGMAADFFVMRAV
jgi:hypothetical protein